VSTGNSQPLILQMRNNNGTGSGEGRGDEMLYWNGITAGM
jgi:hypothetical protein